MHISIATYLAKGSCFQETQVGKFILQQQLLS